MTEKRPYTAASLRELKTIALLNGDREALSKIRRYETEIKTYFQVCGEKHLRDDTGSPIRAEESIFVLLEGFRSADGQVIQPLPGYLWDQIERSEGKIVVQEIRSIEDLKTVKLDSPVRVSGKMKQMNGVEFLQLGPGLCFVSADQLTDQQIQEYIAITEGISEQIWLEEQLEEAEQQ